MLSWLPLALRLLPWGIALAGLIFALAERSSYYACKAARVADIAAAEKAASDFKTADAQRTAQIEATHAAEVAQLQEQLNDRNVAIASAPSSVACVASPPMRALFDSLRARKAGGGH